MNFKLHNPCGFSELQAAGSTSPSPLHNLDNYISDCNALVSFMNGIKLQIFMLPTKYFFHYWYTDERHHSNTIQHIYSSITFSSEPMRILENLVLLLANTCWPKKLYCLFVRMMFSKRVIFWRIFQNIGPVY